MNRKLSAVSLVLFILLSCNDAASNSQVVRIPAPKLEVGRPVGFTVTLASTTVAQDSRVVDQSALTGQMMIVLTRETGDRTKVVLSFQSFLSTSPRGTEIHNPGELFGRLFPTYDPETRSVTFYSSSPSLNLTDVMQNLETSGSFDITGPENLLSMPIQTLGLAPGGNEFQAGLPVRNEVFSPELGKIATSVELLGVDPDKVKLGGWTSIENPRLQGVDHDLKGISTFSQEISLIDGHPLTWLIETRISGNLMLPGELEPVQIDLTAKSELRRITAATGHSE